MRKLTLMALLAVGLLLVPAAHSDAWRGHRHGRFHGHVSIGIGPVWWGPGPWWYYPPPTYVYAPPPVVIQEPPVYVQQPPESFWYYCPNSKAYYPDVPTCSEAWIKVPPRAQ